MNSASFVRHTMCPCQEHADAASSLGTRNVCRSWHHDNGEDSVLVQTAAENACKVPMGYATTMTPYTLLKEVYSLDTLDTRLTTSSKTPAKEANDISAKTAGKDGRAGTDIPPGASPSKYNTLEFYVYALVFVVCVPLMYKAVWDVSQRMWSTAHDTGRGI